jgi:uncharacterized protein (TIGR03000 family)
VIYEHYAPADSSTPTPPAPPTTGEQPSASTGTTNAILTVDVPDDAKVFVNDLATTSTGSQRRYVSRNLQAGYSYTYKVRAEVVRNGEKVEETKVVDLRSGKNTSLAFKLEPTASVVTTVTLNVPADAKVILAGSETTSTGAVRVFSTKTLPRGEVWSDYKIAVSVDRNGQTMSKEKVVTLKAGDAPTFSFDFDEAKVAQAR